MALNRGPRIVTSGLVLCLDAANKNSYKGSGTSWLDLSGNNNHSTLFNTPSFSNVKGGSLVFNGTNNYVTNPYLPSGTNLFTLSCWIYFNGNIAGDFTATKGAVIFSGGAMGTMECVVLTQANVAGPPYYLNFARFGGGTVGTNASISPLNMPVNNYYNITLVRDGAASEALYQNGILIGTYNVSNSFNTGTLYMGGNPNTAGYTGYLNGNLFTVLGYNRALSASEVLQNFNATRRRFGI